MIAQELEVSLHMAFVEARQQRHEFITVEHLLLSLLDNPSAAEVLRACAANIDELRKSLTGFIKENTPVVPGTEEIDTQPTLGFQRVIQRAIMHVQSTSNGKPKRRRPGSAHSPYRRVPEGDQLLGAGLRSVTEEVTFGSRRFSYQVSAGGFWQIHRAAPSTMVGTMLTMLRPQEGECALDLYAGAGLFTAALADAVGATGTVVSIEGSPVTHKDARSNFAPDGCSRTENSANTRIEVIRGDVARHLVDLKTALEFGEIPAIDAVVLDPSREGANRTTLERLDALDPKRILYVACDPASLGRDTGILRELGWDMVQLRAFDMYPNTHHVESVALFERAPAKPRPRRRRTT